MWTAVHIAPCTGKNAHKNALYAATSLIIIEVFKILTRDFSKKQYVLPEDDMRYAIETCRNIFFIFEFQCIISL